MSKALLLFVFLAVPALADDLDLWIGFGAVQAKPVNGGKIAFVDVLVGSNENPDQAAKHDFAAKLRASGPNGSCTSSTLRKTKVKPAISVLRLEVFYPNQIGSIVPAPVQYTLRASLSGAPDPKGSPDNNTKEFKFSFPGGGTVTCVKVD